MASKYLTSPTIVFTSAILLRLILLVYSHWQDTHSAVKYTDIDYLVFTDAARFVHRGRSPYDRETYRYTPLLAWLLTPTVYWFDFGKVLFALGDVLAGWLLQDVLQKHYGVARQRATAFAAVWLLNPMVANISTRGSSEGLLGVLAVGLLKAGLERRVALAGIILGFAVHWKIYPFIYATSLIWWLDDNRPSSRTATSPLLVKRALSFCNADRLRLALYSLTTFMAFNILMLSIYGTPYLTHSWTYHLTRIDHRHNFSPYNTLLHLNSSPFNPSPSQKGSSSSLERLAFAPQLLLSALVIPLALAKKDLAGAMLCQTFAFVTFNKVCTSQYFLWYLVFLPLYLPHSTLLHKQPRLGVLALLAWIAGQAGWLWQGYKLEFLGQQTFVPGLWYAGLAFFAVNCWILGLLVSDVASRDAVPSSRIPKGIKSA